MHQPDTPQDCEPISTHPRSGGSSPDWNDNIVKCQIWFIWGGAGFHGADWVVLSPLGQEVHWSGACFGPTCLRMEIVSSGGWRGVYIPEEARSSSPSRGACVCTAAFEERAGLVPTRGLNHSLDKATFITLQAVSSSSHWSSFSCDLELWAPPCHRY